MTTAGQAKTSALKEYSRWLDGEVPQERVSLALMVIGTVGVEGGGRGLGKNWEGLDYIIKVVFSITGCAR